jgi:hypothetical protein
MGLDTLGRGIGALSAPQGMSIKRVSGGYTKNKKKNRNELYTLPSIIFLSVTLKAMNEWGTSTVMLSLHRTVYIFSMLWVRRVEKKERRGGNKSGLNTLENQIETTLKEENKQNGFFKCVFKR